jgi:hypothetical protein
MKRLLALLATLIAALPALAAPSVVEAEYKIFKNGILIAYVTEKFERKGETYRIDSTSVASGGLKMFVQDKVVMAAEGKFGASGLQPLVYEDLRTNPNDSVRLTFDWTKMVLKTKRAGKEESEPLTRGALDRLSFLYQFMWVARPDGYKVEMSGGRKLEAFHFRKAGEPVLKTPAGTFETVHLERIRAGDREDKAQIWLAKDMGNVPIRIWFQNADGTILDQTIVELKTR